MKIRQGQNDSLNESRDDAFMDIDRMVNEGLGGGTVSNQNGLIEETTTDTMSGSFKMEQEQE
ncbi:hypothetical protein ACQCN2_11525 [Brevibacillus ginsengisoli]|uniref:hypothetical protein n=1 Tax=Brevibacillus ginsengisoli TaxID=363854 RepID=UPI003CF237EB